MAITRRGTQIFKLAADAKPTAADVQAGTELINTDDRKRWINGGTDWILQDLPTYKKFKVFKDGATTYVTDINGKILQSNTDTQIAVQAQIDTIVDPQVFEFEWDAAPFTMNNPIIFPTSTQGLTKKIKMKGNGVAAWRSTSTSTRLSASTSFPTNRYLFELNCTGPTNATTGMVEIDGFQVDNINNLGTKNVGFLKLEAGNIVYGLNNFIIKNIYAEYMWRVIHLLGAVWFGVFEDIGSYESNASFVGDNVLLLEDGGHTGPTNPTPKVNDFNRIRAMHGAGAFTDFLRIKSGGYNTFRNFFVNGYKYLNASLNLNNTDTLAIHNNTFRDNYFIDLNGVVSPDTRVGNLYMAGTAVFDNTIFNLRCAPWSGGGTTIRIGSTGVERNYIEIPAYFGLTTQINDTGSGQSNTIRIITGGSVIGGTETPIAHIGGISRIIDSRRGAEKGGATSVAEGGTISHGLFANPITIFAQSRIPGEMVYVTARNSTTFTVSFRKHDNTAGTTPQTIDWKASVYA